MASLSAVSGKAAAGYCKPLALSCKVKHWKCKRTCMLTCCSVLNSISFSFLFILVLNLTNHDTFPLSKRKKRKFTATLTQVSSLFRSSLSCRPVDGRNFLHLLAVCKRSPRGLSWRHYSLETGIFCLKQHDRKRNWARLMLTYG